MRDLACGAGCHLRP